MRQISLALLWIMTLGSGGRAFAAHQPQTLVDQAVEQYRSAMESQERDERLDRFRRSFLLFQKASEQMSSPSASLLTNLGNAALQSEQIGPAIASYRRALKVQPGYRRAAANLTYARLQVPDWARYQTTDALADTLFFWNSLFSQAAIRGAAAACFLLAALLVAASWLRRQPILRLLAVFPAIVWITLWMSAHPDWFGSVQESAVLVSSDVIGRTADSAAANAKFPNPIPAGTETIILESRENWTHIEFGGKQTAWIPTSSLQRLVD